MPPSRVRIPPSPSSGPAGPLVCGAGNLCGRSVRWQSGRMRRSRKPLGVVRLLEGSNPSLSAGCCNYINVAARKQLSMSGRLRGKLLSFEPCVVPTRDIAPCSKGSRLLPSTRAARLVPIPLFTGETRTPKVSDPNRDLRDRDSCPLFSPGEAT